MHVPFPGLPPNPPTDSEATTSTMSNNGNGDHPSQLLADRDDDHRRCSEGDGSVSEPCSDAAKSTSSSSSSSCPSSNKAAVTSSSDPQCSSREGSLKDPPENQASTMMSPGQRQQQEQQPLDDDDLRQEIEIEPLDFTVKIGRRHHDPANQIKAALHNYVLAVRRRKKRLEELGMMDHPHPHPAANTDTTTKDCQQEAAAVATGKRPHEACTAAAAAAECQKEQGSNQFASSCPSKEPQKQRPIQVIMSWMDSFQDHEKVQLICLQSLPAILESPPNRLAAQADGLASIVLYDMAAFPNNSLLQLTAFHTLVVLLRPLGTNEGMVHTAAGGASSKSSGSKAAAGVTSKSSKGIRSINHKKHRHHHNHHHHSHHHNHHHHPTHMSVKSSINAVDRNNQYQTNPQQQQQQQQQHHQMQHPPDQPPLADTAHQPRWEENGVRVMLDSLRRFSSDRYLQAMGCWAMVNAALYPTLKRSLLKLGGVYAVTNAMMLHPNVEAVQFRGLFALINLVIPDNRSKTKQDGDGSSIDSHIYQIARLTILAMKTFHMNKSILNRGCLVLRNLSLTPSFVKILARTPGCVDMLLHCRQVCGPRDVLVQRSARTIMILVQRVMTEKIAKKDGGEEEDGTGSGGSGSGSMEKKPELLRGAASSTTQSATPGTSGASSSSFALSSTMATAAANTDPPPAKRTRF